MDCRLLLPSARSYVNLPENLQLRHDVWGMPPAGEWHDYSKGAAMYVQRTCIHPCMHALTSALTLMLAGLGKDPSGGGDDGGGGGHNDDDGDVFLFVSVSRESSN